MQNLALFKNAQLAYLVNLCNVFCTAQPIPKSSYDLARLIVIYVPIEFLPGNIAVVLQYDILGRKTNMNEDDMIAIIESRLKDLGYAL